MKPEQMSKLLITGPKTKMEKVIGELHRLKIMHIVDHKRTSELDIGSPLEKSEELSEVLVMLRSVSEHLKIKLDKPDFLYASKFIEKHGKKTFNVIKKNVDELHSNVLDKLNKLKEVNEKINDTNLKIDKLKYLAALNLKPEFFTEYKSICWFIGFIGDKNLEEKLKKITERYIFFFNEYEGKQLLAIFIDINKKKEVNELLEKYSFKAVDIGAVTDLKGNSKQILKEFIKKNNNLNIRKQNLLKQISNLNKRYSKLLKAGDYILSKDIEKAQAPLKFGVTKSIFTITGWVPTKNLQNVADRLYNVANKKLFMQVQEIDKYEDVPIKLKNKKIIKPFEFFMHLYTLPSYKELDPSFIMFLTFPFLFGFMLGDIGYGLTILILLLLVRKKLKNALIDIMIFASIGTIFFGALFGEVFGFEVLFGFHLPHILSRGHDITQLLYLAVAVGVLHLNLGLIIGFINELKSHGFLKAFFCKIAWIILQLGVALLALSYTKILAIRPIAGYATLIIAIIMLYKGEGVQGLVELPSIFSNILSYARLMAIGLSSVSLAIVINGFVGEFFSKGGLMIIVGILVLIIGHIINIGVGILGSFLHSLRLHYVEFFTKFYHGGGQEYKPFGIEQEGG